MAQTLQVQSDALVTLGSYNPINRVTITTVKDNDTIVVGQYPNISLGSGSITELNDLSAAVVWVNVPDVYITESSVVQWESSLTITESQISDLNHFTPTSLLVDYGFTDNSSNWNTAYSWGDHSLEGYLTSSDISNFETTTQLNIRDTNNRARANHTGTQLTSTISDFEEEVLFVANNYIKVSGSFTVTTAHNGATIKVSGTTPTITFNPNTQAYQDKFSVYFLKQDTTDATFAFTAASGWTYTYDNLTLTGEGGRCGVLRFEDDDELILLGNE